MEFFLKNNLFIISHCGYDIAFAREDVANPHRISNIINKLPELTFVATHFGGWNVWEEVNKYLIGKKIYIETSFSLGIIDNKIAENFFNNHREDYLIFGTDSPWNDQKESLEKLKSFNLKSSLFKKITSINAHKLIT